MPLLLQQECSSDTLAQMTSGSHLPLVDSSYLYHALRSDSPEEILILDCRGVAEYSSGHVRGALNVALPSLMLRRLASGKLSLQQVLRHLAPEACDTVARLYRCVPVVLYDHSELRADAPVPVLMTALGRRLIQEGCSAHCLAGNIQNSFCSFIIIS